MVNNLIILFSCINLTLAVGLKALVIPQNALSLASSSTGLADYTNVDLNPAVLAFQNPHVSFSDNNWYADMKGQKVSVIWNEDNISYFSFESLNVTDIELRDEIANEEPIGFFGAYWYAFDYSKTLNLDYLEKNGINLGYSLTCSLSKLYTESMRAITLNVGAIKNITNNLRLGLVVRDFGREYYNGLTENLQPEIGFGVSHNLKSVPMYLSSDIIYRDEVIFNKVSLRTDFQYINLICGITESDSYSDYSFGLRMDFNDWSFVFGNLVHDNASLGNPSSLEIIKTF